MDLLFNIIGAIGVVLILLAYFLLAKGQLKGEDMSYHLLNFLGAILLLISLSWTPNIPSIVIEVCWLAISIFGMVKVLKTRKSNEQSGN